MQIRYPVRYVAALICAGLAIAVLIHPRLFRWEAQSSGPPVATLRVGVAVESPYVRFDEQRQLTGLEVEVVKRIAEQVGIPHIEWQQTDFNLLIPELNAGRFDMIAAGLFITPARAEVVDFSEPTFHVRQTLLIRSGNPKQLHAYEDIKREPTVKVAVLQGSVEESLLMELGLPESRIVLVPDALTGRVAVETGLADCTALSLPSVRSMVEQHALGQLEVADPFLQPALPGSDYRGYGAMAFRKSDGQLRAAWNRRLREFVGSAEHRAVMARFGFGDSELPGGISTAEILAANGR